MFSFNEMVRVIASPKYPKLVGLEGYVAGKTYQDDDAVDGPVLDYGVFLFSEGEVYGFEADEIASLGAFVDKGVVNSGVSLKVKNIRGHGIIVDEA